jgi:hypothetical protein
MAHVAGGSIDDPITITSSDDSDDRDVLIRFNKKTHRRHPIISSSDESESDDDVLVHVKKKNSRRKHLLPSSDESESDDDDRKVNSNAQRSFKKTSSTRKKTKQLDMVEKYDIARAGLQLILNGNSDDFYKFRGRFVIENMWLKHLQKTAGDLFCYLSGKRRVMEFYNYNSPAKGMEPRTRPIGSDIDSHLPALSKMKGGKFYGGLNGGILIKHRPSGAGKLEYSATPKPGFEFAKIPAEKGFEIYLSQPRPAIKKGLHIVSDLTDLIELCNERGVRFAVAVLHVKFNATRSHGNALIYDRVKRTLTRFEPHGAVTRSYDSSKLDSDLAEFVHSHQSLFSGGYIAPSSFCPVIGPQTKERLAGFEVKMGEVFGRNVKIEAGGFCSAWAQLFLHKRILHPDATNQEIAEMFNSEPDVLAREIRAYMAYIVRTVQEIVQ